MKKPEVYPGDHICEGPHNKLAWELLTAARTVINPGETNWTEAAKWVERNFVRREPRK